MPTRNLQLGRYSPPAAHSLPVRQAGISGSNPDSYRGSIAHANPEPATSSDSKKRIYAPISLHIFSFLKNVVFPVFSKQFLAYISNVLNSSISNLNKTSSS
ncbi:MAG: hypothetical protein ACK5YS_05620 [bacterium]